MFFLENDFKDNESLYKCTSYTVVNCQNLEQFIINNQRSVVPLKKNVVPLKKSYLMTVSCIFRRADFIN